MQSVSGSQDPADYGVITSDHILCGSGGVDYVNHEMILSEILVRLVSGVMVAVRLVMQELPD